MKGNVYSAAGAKVSQIDLPIQFSEPVRKDLIKKAVLAVQSNNYQPYGPDPEAGTKQGGATSKRRHKHGTLYGQGVSRVMRKSSWKRGGQFGWEAAFVANVVGGRKAFPPEVGKIISKKINVTERRKAIRSAISATTNEKLVSERGHKFGTLAVPVILDSKIEEMKKTKEVRDTLVKLGLGAELERTTIKKVRAGKGKGRGRRYKKKIGPLLVTGKECNLLKSAQNIPGVDAVDVRNLNAELLAPGTEPGRLVLWTKSAIEKLEKEKLFM